jgi:hypothetical protein
MATRLTVSVKRQGASDQVDIEELTDDELRDLLRRATPTQVRAYAFILATWICDHILRQKSSPLVGELAAQSKQKPRKRQAGR